MLSILLPGERSLCLRSTSSLHPSLAAVIDDGQGVIYLIGTQWQAIVRDTTQGCLLLLVFFLWTGLRNLVLATHIDIFVLIGICPLKTQARRLKNQLKSLWSL